MDDNYEINQNKNKTDYIEACFLIIIIIVAGWIAFFLFIYKNIIFPYYKDNNSSQLCLSEEILMLLNDIFTINDENILFQRIWN